MASDLPDAEAPTELPTVPPTQRATDVVTHPMGAPRTLKPGDVVGRYEIAGTLGQGGMGVVFEAEDPQLRRTIALKVLHPKLSDGSSFADDARTRLKREAQAMARVSHPNVVTVTDVGEHEGDIYIAMERIEGVTLRQWLQERPRTPEEILTVFADAAAGLKAVHDADLVHRDFKPDNVMVAGSRVVVMDLGLARVEVLRPTEEGGEDGAEEPTLGETGMTRGVAGTPGYIAPEQLAGSPADPRSDQFAFAVSMYEALYGARPFQGRTLPEIVHSMEVDGPPTPPADARVPAVIQAAVQRGLAADPAHRFESVEALIRAATPTRRLSPWVPIGVLAAAGAAAALVWPKGEALPGCGSPQEAREGSWGAAERKEVAARMDELGAAWRHVAGTAVERLDEWIADWDETYRDACALSQPRARDAAVFCLRRRLASFDGLVEGLRRVDDQAADGAFSALLDLPSATGCNEAAEVELPEAQQSLLLAAERASTALMAGEVAPAEALIAEVDLDAVDGRLAYHVEELHAMVDTRAGDNEAAARRFESAYLRARAAGLDEDALETATLITMEAAYNTRDPERSRWWRREVEALLASVEPPPHVEVLARLAVGSALLREGDHDEALPRLEAAVELAERTLPQTDLAKARAYNQLGGARFELKRFEEALEAYLPAQEQFRVLLGADQVQTAQLDSNIGITLVELKRLDEALERHDRAIEVLERLIGADHLQTTIARLNRSEALSLAGRHEEAIAEVKQSIEGLIARVGEDSPMVGVARDSLAKIEKAAADAAKDPGDGAGAPP